MAEDKRAEEARAAIKIADYAKAEALLTAIEEDEPERGHWPQQLADLFRRTQRKQDEIFALSRAADRYTKGGQQLKALVMLKRMLDLDPDNAATRRRLASLHPAVAGKPGKSTEAPPPLELAPEPRPSGSSGSVPVFSNDELEAAFESRVLDRAPTPETPELDLLGASPFFAAIGAAGVAQILPLLRVREFPKGSVVFRKGDTGDSLYLVASGKVSVRLDDEKRTVVAELDEGEFFGEMAAFTREPRMATVEAATPVELVEINRAALESLVAADPGLLSALRWFLRDRLVDLLVRTSPLFTLFPESDRRRMVRHFRFIEAGEGAAIIQQDSAPRGLVVILAGRVAVKRRFPDTTVDIAMLGSGAMLGEMGLLTGEPAVADAITESRFVGLELPVADFRALTAKHPELLKALEAMAEKRRQDFVEAVELGLALAEGFVPIT